MPPCGTTLLWPVAYRFTACAYCFNPSRLLYYFHFRKIINLQLSIVKLASNSVSRSVIASIVEPHFHGNLPRKLMPQASTPNMGYIFLRSLFTYKRSDVFVLPSLRSQNPQLTFLTSLNLSFIQHNKYIKIRLYTLYGQHNSSIVSSTVSKTPKLLEMSKTPTRSQHCLLRMQVVKTRIHN